MKKLVFFGVFWLTTAVVQTALAQSFVVQPYLQRATESTIEIHWETTGAGESFVSWGKTPQLGQRATTRARPSGRRGQLHAARLDGLESGTRYFYRVHTGSLSGGIADFRTPAAPSAEADTRLIVMSDMQLDRKHPHVFRDLVREGVLPLVGEGARTRGEAPAMLLLPGDLVRHGRNYAEWSEEFFAPLREVSRHVPLYPVAGNHDEDSPHYFRYFSLPSDGSPAHPQRWWSTDVSNVRVVGLDTNPPHAGEEQLAWLTRVLDAACTAPHIDFVFAALHHPELSELWPHGELAYSGRVTRALERFSQQCQKPSVVFSGHTHAYARGHSRDAPVTLVSVASAGGDLDRKGEYRGRSYPEYVTSQDDYGFVVVDVKAGDAPSFRIQRFSRGTPERPRENELRDDLTVRRFGQPPARPEAVWPRDERVSPGVLTLISSAFADPDGDAHAASAWQVTDARCDFARPAIDQWTQHVGTTSAGMNTLRLADLLPDTGYCYRTRVRDSTLQWSAWSLPMRFRTLPRVHEEIAQQSSPRAF